MAIDAHAEFSATNRKQEPGRTRTKNIGAHGIIIVLIHVAIVVAPGSLKTLERIIAVGHEGKGRRWWW